MRTDRYSHSFFTDVGMQGAHDFALTGLVFRLLLEEANAPHATIDCFESISGWCLDRHWHILHIMVANTGEGRYASCAHTVAPERRSGTSCAVCMCCSS